MPYFIWDESPSCSGWSVVKADGEEMSCHSSKQEAIDAMVGVSVTEGIEPGGMYDPADDDLDDEDDMDELEMRAKAGDLETGDFVAWQSSGGTARGRVTRIVTEGRLPVPDTDLAINATEDDPAALIRIYRPRNDGWLPTRTLVGHKFRPSPKLTL